MKARDKVLAVALKVINEEGLWNTTLTSIRKSGKISTGSLYHHFPGGMEQLIGELYARTLAEVHSHILASVTTVSSFAELIEGAFLAYLDWHEQHRELSGFVVAVTDASFPQNAETLRTLDRGFAMDLLERMQGLADQDGLRLESPDWLAACLFGATRYATHGWVRAGYPKERYEQLRATFPRLLLKAFVA